MGCELWQQFGLDQFWEERLPEGRERIGWDKVLQLLVINRLIEPGSEFRLHRHWIVSSAMDEPLNTDFIVAKKDRLYRCLDRLLEPKRDLFLFLRQKWADLFAADFEVLLGKNCADRIRGCGQQRVRRDAHVGRLGASSRSQREIQSCLLRSS